MTTMRTQAMKLIGLVSVATALIGGCGDSPGTNNDGGAISALACTANQKACINDRVARICPADGSNWIILQCSASESCQAGDCVAATAPPTCTAAQNGCLDATTALRCSSSGAGFDSITCPSGTGCTGPGLCDGGCIVGSSICTDQHTIASCNDGKTYTAASCGEGQACVRTGDSPMITSACKTAACTPDVNGCDAVCGNKADTAATNQQAYVSVCTETPDGYKWVATSCVAPKTCSPSAGSCGAGGRQAACASTCTPGDQRCTTLAGAAQGDVGTGHQTCTAEGTWGATVTACNASPTSVTSVCFPNPASPNRVLCGDPACVDGEGSCDPAGLFHACGADGRLATTGVVCQGTCVATGDGGPGGAQAGRCVAQCEPGDERCLDAEEDSQTYQVCGADKRWGAVTACPGDNYCFGYANAAGRPRKSCGECLPGVVRCSDDQGNSANNGAGYVQTCGAGGEYGAPVACAVGSCSYSNDSASCVADCFPGSTVCIGDGKAVAGSVYGGSEESGTCTAEGRMPAGGTGTLCAGDAVCRWSSAGVAIGCTVCIGTTNEFGLPDTRCSDETGAPGGNHVQTCLADGTGWNTAVLACGGDNGVCYDPTTNISPPVVFFQGAYCHGDYGFPEITEQQLMSFNWNCNIASQGSFPMSCGSLLSGTVSDCCSDYCYADEAPRSAFCGPGPI